MRVIICLVVCVTLVIFVAPVGGRRVRKRCKPLAFKDTTSLCDKEPNGEGWYRDGTVCMLDCREGCVKKTGGRRRVCKVRGRSKWWTGGRGLQCFCRPCASAPPAVPNTSGPQDCTSPYTAGATCIYECSPGYVKIGGDDSKLCSDGQWRGADLMCEPEPDVDGSWVTWGSWASCDVTCGGGVKTRTRTCTNPEPSGGGADCVGDTEQTRDCNDFPCPDCMRICALGTLNDACDACTCDGHELTGHVMDTRRVPLSDADIFYAEKPNDPVASTDTMGNFRLSGACAQGVEIIARTRGYFDARATSSQQDETTSTVQVEMAAEVPPIIDQHPQSKKRIAGQDVTFCCAAHGNPPISSYEWFKDGLVLDEAVYSYNDTLTLTGLTVDDSGVYRCRANSDAGAKYSEEATLAVEEDSMSSCAAEPEENFISLPDDCIQEDTNSTGYDIGACGGDDCVGDLGEDDKACVDTMRFCCVPTSTETRTVQCSGYSLNVTVTTECGCGSCVKTSTKRIQGRAYGLNRTDNASTEIPLKYGPVIKDGQVVDITSETGIFEFTIETTASKIALTFRDNFKKLVTSTRVLSLTGSDTLDFDVVLKLRPPPVTLMSSQNNVIDLGTVEGEEPLAELDIPADSLFTADGEMFTGEVKASVSFIDPRNPEDFELIQGELTAVDVEGREETMETFGMFNMDFETETGDSLELGGNISVHIDPSQTNIDLTDVDENGILGTKLWLLNQDTGLWQEAGSLRVGTATRRRKRSTFVIGEFLYVADSPCNFDRVEPYSRRCFAEIRAYDSLSNLYRSKSTGIGTGAVRNADVALVTTSNRGRFSRLNSLSVYRRGRTNYKGAVCLETLCEPTGNDFSARINVVKYNTHLLAALYPGFDANLQNSIEIKDDGKTLSFDVFKPSHTNGPIYTYFDWWDCYYRSTVSDNHFAFVDNTYRPYVFPPYFFNQNQYSQPITVTSWYPNETDLKSVCFIKVFVKFEFADTTAVRVTSKGGGVYEANTGVTYGIREDRTTTNPTDPTSGFVCVEFKCPGPILESVSPRQPQNTSPPYPGANDSTRITITARKSICTADPGSGSITTEGINNSLLDNVADVVRDGNMNEFTVPNGNSFGRDQGIYIATGSGDTGYRRALDYCRTGSNSGRIGRLPFDYEQYYAVRFNCGNVSPPVTQGTWILEDSEPL
ncbi:cartilage intermediate layer protein 1-like isoform X2 [Branchiostoma lanceolatum]|uniref:cartilage intermediate layer protein 1-like isoform X2 n=2 Tax=Branchiostoma lanceolatum TaxID=7740 RepID=UPI0034516631